MATSVEALVFLGNWPPVSPRRPEARTDASRLSPRNPSKVPAPRRIGDRVTRSPHSGGPDARHCQRSRVMDGTGFGRWFPCQWLCGHHLPRWPDLHYHGDRLHGDRPHRQTALEHPRPCVDAKGGGPAARVQLSTVPTASFRRPASFPAGAAVGVVLSRRATEAADLAELAGASSRRAHVSWTCNRRSMGGRRQTTGLDVAETPNAWPRSETLPAPYDCLVVNSRPAPPVRWYVCRHRRHQD